jgi:hypothetical protein
VEHVGQVVALLRRHADGKTAVRSPGRRKDQFREFETDFESPVSP